MLQEAVTLVVFVPFAVLFMKQAPRWDFLWAGLCIVGAVFFMFRGHRLA
ncbi:MAG TPA: DMT family protein [Gemmatimonadaceae bacterium]|nr:DMT family protein [Gemmatimonadaceae bacterium]